MVISAVSGIKFWIQISIVASFTFSQLLVGKKYASIYFFPIYGLKGRVRPGYVGNQSSRTILNSKTATSLELKQGPTYSANRVATING